MEFCASEILTLFDRFDVPADCSVELSPLGYQFFTDIFEIYDKVIYFHRSNVSAQSI